MSRLHGWRSFIHVLLIGSLTSLYATVSVPRVRGDRSVSASRRSTPNPGDFGATAEYAVQLHDLGEMEALRSEVARDNDLDPLSPLHADILVDAVALRLSIRERLEHFSARWEREVAPLMRRMGDVTSGVVASAEALSVRTFDDVRRQAHILALPAA